MQKALDTIPIHFGKFTSLFSYALPLQSAQLHMLVLTCNAPYFLHMYLIDQRCQKSSYQLYPGLIAVTEIFVLESSMRKLFVNPNTACFVAA